MTTGETKESQAPEPPPGAMPPPPALSGVRRCGNCGSPLPPGFPQGYGCPTCRRRVLYAPIPTPRGPAGWCRHHPRRPVTGVCGVCGVFTCVECEVSVRGLRYCEPCRIEYARHLAAPVAWEERREIGRIRAWWRTTVDVTARPHLMYEAMPPRGELGSAMSYGLIGSFMQSSTQLMFLAMYVVILGLVGIAMVASGSGSDGWIMLGVAGAMLFAVLLTPVIALFSFLLLAAFQHLALLLVGAGKGGLEATLKVACYAMGTGWVGVIPYFGAMIQPFWWTVLMVIGVGKVHRCSTTKSLVVLVPMVIACVAPVMAYVLVIVIAAVAELL